MKSRLPKSVELDDVVSGAALGLLKAVRSFDSTRGLKLVTFALHKMRGGALDELREMDHAPRLMRKRGEAPKLESIEKAFEAGQKSSEPVEQGFGPLKNALVNDVFSRLKRVLSANEYEVLRLYYRADLTLWEIGVKLRLSESRVCQLHAKAIAKARRRLA